MVSWIFLQNIIPTEISMNSTLYTYILLSGRGARCQLNLFLTYDSERAQKQVLVCHKNDHRGYFHGVVYTYSHGG